MICGGCKTIIGLDEEDDTLDCGRCETVFCSECMYEEDFWHCPECDRIFCDACILVNYYLQTLEDDEDPGTFCYDDDEHYLTHIQQKL